MIHEAKYLVACDVAKEDVQMRKFIFELGVVPSIELPIPLYCDNRRAIAQAKEPKSHQKSKHIKHHFHLIREIIVHGDVPLQNVASLKNVANPLTKALTQAQLYHYL